MKKNSMTGDRILGMVIDPQYTIDIDTPKDWARSEWLVWHGGLSYVDPAKKPRRQMPEKIDLMYSISMASSQIIGFGLTRMALNA